MKKIASIDIHAFCIQLLLAHNSKIIIIGLWHAAISRPLTLLLSTGWFEEQIRVWFHNRTKIKWGPYVKILKL